MSGSTVSTGGREAGQEWELVNPEGAIKIEPMKVNPHPATLSGKTVVLRGNGKHNSNHYLERIGELLKKEVGEVRIINNWDAAAETFTISQNPERSKQFGEKIASLKPDLVIGAQGD